MLTKVCMYNNKLFMPDVSDFGSYIFVYSYNKHNKTQENFFYKHLKIKIPIKCTQIKTITLEVVNNFVTGLKSVLILIFNLNGLKDAFMYCDTLKRKLAHIILPEFLLTRNVQPFELFVSDGPTFLLPFNDTVYVYSEPYRISNTIDEVFRSKFKDWKILQFSCLGLYTNDTIQHMLFFLIISANFSSNQQVTIISFISNLNKMVVKYEQLPIPSFFPQYYQTVLKAIKITHLFLMNKTKSCSLTDFDWEENISIMCTVDECLIFKNGTLKYCCKLTIPFLETMCITTELSDIFLNNINFILIAENKTVYFVATTEHKSCEVIKYWTNVEATVTGDILLKGSKQVLLLKSTDLNLWEENCYLIDLLSFLPVDLLSQNVIPDECAKTTIAGLEHKIEIGKSAIVEVEQEISQKSAAAVYALSRLKDFQINEVCLQNSNNFQESLVDLILCKEENKAPTSTSQTRCSVKLLGETQRFLNDHWIMCFYFINEGDRNICNLSFKVLLKNCEMENIQKLFIYCGETISYHNKSSRQVNSKTKFTIISKLKFSTLTDDDLIIFILTWFDGSVAEYNNEMFANDGRKVLVQHQLCFEERIKIADVLNCSVERALSSPEDILFMRSSQQRIVLQISSLHSDLSQYENMLLSSEILSTKLQALHSSSSNCLIFSNHMFHLFGVNILSQFLNKKKVIFEAFTRNKNEIQLLVHLLYQCLPEDVLISPSIKSEVEFSQTKKDAACALKDELDLVIASMNIHNINDVQKNYSTLMSSQNVGTITIPKRTYHRIRRALMKKECITDSLLKSIIDV